MVTPMGSGVASTGESSPVAASFTVILVTPLLLSGPLLSPQLRMARMRPLTDIDTNARRWTLVTEIRRMNGLLPLPFARYVRAGGADPPCSENLSGVGVSHLR